VISVCPSGGALLRSRVFAAGVRPELTALVGASIFVEEAFGINGLGRTIGEAAQRRDLPLLAGAALFIALVAIVNLAADLLAYAVDPRERPERQARSRVRTALEPVPAPSGEPLGEGLLEV
jgi:ABC-type proline/glycine betaine transport system permease subunit